MNDFIFQVPNTYFIILTEKSVSKITLDTFLKVFTCEMLISAKVISVDLNLYSNCSVRFSDLEGTRCHKHKLNTRGMKIDQNCVKYTGFLEGTNHLKK